MRRFHLRAKSKGSSRTLRDSLTNDWVYCSLRGTCQVAQALGFFSYGSS